VAWAKHHKEKTRQRILDSAASRFLQLGYDAVSIDEIMADAELTRGAFYTHFSSKKQLYAEAIKHAGRQSSSSLESKTDPQDKLCSVIGHYLSPEHCAGETLSCPLALLITDITHRDETVRNAYTQTLQGFLNLVERHATSDNVDISSTFNKGT